MIEVMIAMVLTAVAIMGIIALYATETKASNFSRHSTEAAILAQDRLEKLRTGAPTTTGSPEVGINERGGIAGTGIFTRSWTVTATANYWDMRVVVTWADDGVTHTVTMNGRRQL